MLAAGARHHLRDFSFHSSKRKRHWARTISFYSFFDSYGAMYTEDLELRNQSLVHLSHKNSEH